MNQYKKLVFDIVIVLLALSLASCAAVPLPADGINSIMQGATLYGIEKALAGAPETFIMQSLQNRNIFLVSWNVPGSGWAFVILDANGSAKAWSQVAGNITTPKNINELIGSAIGLKFVFVRNLSEASLALCRGYEIAKSWISETAGSMPVIIVLPVGAFDIPAQILPPVGEIE
jgi:hypothetical protein